MGGRPIAQLGSIALVAALAGCRSLPTREVDATHSDAPEIDAPEIDAPEIDAAIDASAIDAAPEGPPGVPDLQLVAASMRRYLVTPTKIPEGHCAVQDGCVSGTGVRTLVRFPTVTVNRGTADLVLPPLPAPGMSNPDYDWSECHKHHHFNGYTTYELVGRDGIVAVGRKQAFCLADMQQIDPGVPRPRYRCTEQGLSRGWADVYELDLDCQWIDATGIAPGTYLLRVVVNPDGKLPDSDRTNNVFTMPVQL